MTAPADVLLFTQGLLADYIGTDPYFVDIPIITENEADIEGEVTKALSLLQGKGGKSGICVMIQTPTGRRAKRNLEGLQFSDVPLVCTVAENTVFNQGANGTQKHALVVAQMLAALMSEFASSEVDGLEFWLDESPVTVVNPEFFKESPIERAYNVVIHAKGGITYKVNRVANPLIRVVDTTVTAITCATEGASIYFTTDGTRPTKENGTLWAGVELPLEAGTVLRVRAYKDALRASLITEVTITEP